MLRRLLHEASGGWFWAKGPDACIKLWKLVVERLTVPSSAASDMGKRGNGIQGTMWLISSGKIFMAGHEPIALNIIDFMAH